MNMEKALPEILSPVAETFGIAMYDPARTESILINEHEIFPSASVIKVPMLVELFCRRDEGNLSLDEIINLKPEDKVDGSGILKELHDGIECTLLDLAVLMIVLSDNTATNMIMERLGVNSINDRMRSLGIHRSVLARKMFDFEQAALGKENLCTPHDMMILLNMMAHGEISSMTTSMEMIEIMVRQQWRNKIPLLLPEECKVACKGGGIPGVSHDAAIIYANDKPYILCVMTKGISDAVSANRAIAEASHLIYEHVISNRV